MSPGYDRGFIEQIFGANEQVSGRGLSVHNKAERRGIEFYVPIRSANGPGWHAPHPPPAGASSFSS